MSLSFLNMELYPLFAVNDTRRLAVRLSGEGADRHFFEVLMPLGYRMVTQKEFIRLRWVFLEEHLNRYRGCT